VGWPLTLRKGVFLCFSAKIALIGLTNPGASGRAAFPWQTSMKTNFPLRETEFIGGRNGPETQGCNPAWAINNGVDSHDLHSSPDLSRILPGLPRTSQIFLSRSDAAVKEHSPSDAFCDHLYRNSDLARCRAAQDFRAALQRPLVLRLDQVVAELVALNS
jgi:hypothetical protein